MKEEEEAMEEVYLAGGRDNLQGEEAHVRCSRSAGLKKQKRLYTYKLD